VGIILSHPADYLLAAIMVLGRIHILPCTTITCC